MDALDPHPGFYKLIRGLAEYYLTIHHHLRIEGAHHIPDSGGAVFASNHVSFFDPPALAVAAPRHIDFLARKTLFNHALFGQAIRALNAIPVDQENPDMAGLKTIIGRLRKGRIVALFPEGARSFDGTMQPGEPGIGLVLEKAGVPVIPARFFGMENAWPRGGSPQPFCPVSLVIAPPFTPHSNNPDKRARFQELSDQVMQAIAAIPAPDC